MRKYIVFMALSLISMSTYACEICGCGVGNYYIGLLPNFKHSFFGVRYQFRSFDTRMALDPTQFSKDNYRTMEVWGGFNIGKRWQVLAFIPYNVSHQVSDEGRTDRSGLGDIAMMANYKLFDIRSSSSGNKLTTQRLWLGAGLKVPTGKFNIDPNDPDVASAANTQIGSGSTDIVLTLTHQLQSGRFGVNTNIGYKVNTVNGNKYLFGNRFNINSFVFYSVAAGRNTITPNVGLMYENAGKNKLDGVVLDQTGGHLLAAAGGVEFGMGRISIGGNLQMPVAQDFAGGQTVAHLRGMAHVTFTL